MNIVFDFGNTLTKVAVFEHNKLLSTFVFKNFSKKDLVDIIFKFPKIKNTIISCVSFYDKEIFDSLKKRSDIFIELDNKTPLPIKNKYKTKKTLGKDRIAAVVGAHLLFPLKNILVIDAGSAITYDFIDNVGVYHGGNISPGLSMRFKALNAFTENLPLCNSNEQYEFMGDHTEGAIISGVQNGIIFEMDGYIQKFMQEYNEAQIILTGGDCLFFAKRLKNSIFVEPLLTLIGLNKILEYNDKKS
ncbi:MAG: type III pantothenate kinase [Marinilabiliales bacterium]